MVMDYMAQFSADQTPCQSASEVCNKHVVEFANDVERDEFFKKCIVKVLVKVAFTDMAEGMEIQLRIASNVNLVTNAVILARTGTLLPANLQIGDMYQLAVPPRRWVEGFDFFGVWYELIDNVATAGTVNAWLDDGPESVCVVDTAI